MNVACFLFSFLWRLWDEAHTKYKPEPERLLACFCRHFQISSHSKAEFWKSSSSQKCCHMLWLHIISNLESEWSNLHTDGLRSIHNLFPCVHASGKGRSPNSKASSLKNHGSATPAKPSPRYKIRSAFSFSWTCHQNNSRFPKPHWFAPPGVMFRFRAAASSAWRLGLQGVPPRHLRCTPLMMTREQTWDRKLWCSPAKCRGEKVQGGYTLITSSA